MPSLTKCYWPRDRPPLCTLDPAGGDYADQAVLIDGVVSPHRVGGWTSEGVRLEHLTLTAWQVVGHVQVSPPKRTGVVRRKRGGSSRRSSGDAWPITMLTQTQPIGQNLLVMRPVTSLEDWFSTVPEPRSGLRIAAWLNQDQSRAIACAMGDGSPNAQLVQAADRALQPVQLFWSFGTFALDHRNRTFRDAKHKVWFWHDEHTHERIAAAEALWSRHEEVERQAKKAAVDGLISTYNARWRADDAPPINPLTFMLRLAFRSVQITPTGWELTLDDGGLFGGHHVVVTANGDQLEAALHG